jgi:hypothetical protein
MNAGSMRWQRDRKEQSDPSLGTLSESQNIRSQDMPKRRYHALIGMEESLQVETNERLHYCHEKELVRTLVPMLQCGRERNSCERADQTDQQNCWQGEG